MRSSCCRFVRPALLVFLLGALACTETMNEQPKPENQKSELPSVIDLATGKAKAPSQEELQEKFTLAAQDWFYGQGVGETMLNVSGAVLFPPYALYLLGRAGLNAAGVETNGVTDALPDGAREGVNEVYDTVTSAPGQLNATVAGEDFRAKK